MLSETVEMHGYFILIVILLTSSFSIVKRNYLGKISEACWTNTHIDFYKVRRHSLEHKTVQYKN